MVTPEIRSRVNNAYTPGQTRNKRPTLEWRIAAWQAVNHVAIHERSENGIAVSESVLRMLFRRPEAVKLWYGEGSATADV